MCGPSALCEELEKWPGALWNTPKGTAVAEQLEGFEAHVALPTTSLPVPTAVLPKEGVLLHDPQHDPQHLGDLTRSQRRSKG